MTNIGQIINLIHSTIISKYSNIKAGYKLLMEKDNRKEKQSYVSATNRKPELSPRQTPLSSSTGETGVREAYSEPATTKTMAEKTLSGNRQLKTR